MDGILYLIKRQRLKDLEQITSDWEQLTKLTLETEEFEAFYQFAINDYLAVGKGYAESHNKTLLKKKGLFIDTVTLGKGMQPLIIPKAINAYFTDKIPVKETILNCKNIHDFITYQKVDKKFCVEYNNKLITRINRYYMSTNGAYLYKCKVDEDGKRFGYINMLKDSDVTIVNNLSTLSQFPSNINYNYYIKEAQKIINTFEQKQLTIFDFL